MRTFDWECFWGCYSSVELIPLPWAERSFLIEKILINVRISWDSSHIGVLWPKPNVGRKIFPFKIPWSSLKTCRFHMALTLVALMSIHQGFRPSRTTSHASFSSRTLDPLPFTVVRFMYLSYPIFILVSCPFTLWVRHFPSWTDSWSDGLTHLLRNRTLIDKLD